jgi:hypothetical protein
MIAENGAAAVILSCADTTAIRFLHYFNALHDLQENSDNFVETFEIRA